MRGLFELARANLDLWWNRFCAEAPEARKERLLKSIDDRAREVAALRAAFEAWTAGEWQDNAKALTFGKHVKLRFCDLPPAIKKAYQSAVEKPHDLKGLPSGCAIKVDGIFIVDGPEGIVYITRDAGNIFEAGRIAETVYFRDKHTSCKKIEVHPIVQVVAAPL